MSVRRILDLLCTLNIFKEILFKDILEISIRLNDGYWILLSDYGADKTISTLFNFPA